MSIRWNVNKTRTSHILSWLMIYLHLQHFCLRTGSGTLWLEMSKTTDISEYQLSESLCSSPNSTPTSKHQTNPLNIDSRDTSNIFTHSPPLSHVSNGIKGTPTLLLEEHGMRFQLTPCLVIHDVLLSWKHVANSMTSFISVLQTAPLS